MGGGCGDSNDHSADGGSKAPGTFAEQVALGRQLYGIQCAVCHGDKGQGTGDAPRLVGLDQGALPLKAPAERMLRHEDFVTVADVASFVVMNMPPNKVGSLSEEQYLAILAFALDANGIPLDDELDLERAETLTIPR
jgi:S-disulfanyl-L-cysteine oxidoreductase SoxD